MGFSEGLSIALTRMKTDCRDLFFRQSKSDNRVHPSRNHQYEKSKTKPKPISKKHSSDHPLFKSSYPRDSPASHSQLKLAPSDPRKTSDPRDLYKVPLQQKLQAKRTFSASLHEKERISRTTSLPAGKMDNRISFYPVQQLIQSQKNPEKGERRQQSIRPERIFPDFDSASLISDCSSEHIYEEIAELEENEEYDQEESFLLSISLERRNYLRRCGRAPWDLEETSYSY